jgi:squalene-associated FAD-dependent desaturase
MSAFEQRALARGAGLRVAIVGGGLAGLAAAVAMADSRLQRESNGGRLEIELFESRRMLGGRATSYRDPETGEWIDNCQHVSLGCCTNFDDFCRRTQIDHLFTRESALQFIGPDRRVNVVRRSWLPAPLHLATSLMRLSYFTWRERVTIAAGLRQLARVSAADTADRFTFSEWLRLRGQSQRAIELFWAPVILGALSEEVERASLDASRKVFADVFLRHARGFEMRVPSVSLRSLYDEHVVDWLQRRRVSIQLGTDVRAIEANGQTAKSLLLGDGASREFDFFCVAAPWFRVGKLFSGSLADRLPFLRSIANFQEAPITSVHLWCKHRLRFPHRHAVLPGRFSHWIFDRTGGDSSPYYQVVISAARAAASMSRGDVVAQVTRDLSDVLQEPIRDAVIRAKVITEQRAVFSPSPGAENWRPPQRTSVANLFLAGDWTATGWPATMEGAVRSGYLAAEALLQTLGSEERVLQPDLPAAALARSLLGLH